MKKRLDETTITNELKGSSLFFRRPTAPPEKSNQRPPESPADRSDVVFVRSALRSSDRTVGRRRTQRHSFEFFQDQIEDLNQLSLAAKLRGEPGNMSAMVRAALDQYLRELDQAGD